MHFIFAISSVATLLPFLVSLVGWRPSRLDKYLVAMWIFLAVNAATEIIVFSHSLLGKPNAWVAHIFTPIEYCLLAYVLANWQRMSVIRNAIYVSIPVYLLFFVVLKLTGIESFSQDSVNHLSRPTSLMLLLAISCWSLHQMWVTKMTPVQLNYRFWILLAVMTYSTGSVIVYSFAYIENHQALMRLFQTHAVLNILQSILFTVGVLIVARTDSISPSPSQSKAHADKQVQH